MNLNYLIKEAKSNEVTMMKWIVVTPKGVVYSNDVSLTEDLGNLGVDKKDREYITEIVSIFSDNMKYSLQKSLTGKTEVDDRLEASEKIFKQKYKEKDE